jgi:hypothetical protein
LQKLSCVYLKYIVIGDEVLTMFNARLWTKPWSNCAKSTKLNKLIGSKPIPLILEAFSRKNHMQAFCKTLPLIWNHQTKSMVKRWNFLLLQLYRKWHLALGRWSCIWKIHESMLQFPWSWKVFNTTHMSLVRSQLTRLVLSFTWQVLNN